MPDYSLFIGLLLVLGSAFLGGMLAKLLRQPIIFGYLLAGLLVSSFISGWGIDRHQLSILAEVGLAFLLFTLGLEFTLPKEGRVKRVVSLGAAAQIIGTSLIAFGLLTLFGLKPAYALVAGCAFALSSTAIVVKLLTEKGRMESLSGEIMVGWLLVQDLAVLPMIGLMPLLLGGAFSAGSLITMGIAIVLLLLTLLAAQKLFPPLTDFVASFKSRELLLLYVVAVVFSFAFISSGFGFSFGLGAFLAGLILSHAAANFAVFSEVRPLRDVFLAVFFVSLGLSLEPSFLIAHLPAIALLSTLIILAKSALITVILLLFGYHAKTIFSCSLGLAQVGEFAFVLAAVALVSRGIDQDTHSLIVSVTMLTMVITPWLFALSDKLFWRAKKLVGRFPSLHRRFFVKIDRRSLIEELPFENHAVVIGYGRVGSLIGQILDRANIPYLVIEYNPEVVRKLKLMAKPVVFGDPTDIDVLDLAQVDKAKMVIIAIPDSLTQKMVMANCQALNKKAIVVCRSHFEEDEKELRALGVDHIIHPEFEAALSMGHRVLERFGLNKEEVREKLKGVRKAYQI